MAIKPISQLPDPVQPLSNDDYLMLSVFNPDSGGQLSVKYTLGQLKDYVMGGASCVPSEPVEFTAAWNQLVSHKRLTFSINGSPPSIFTGLPEVGDDDADINFEDYFSRFAAANRVGDDYPIISTTGSNQCAFRVGFDNESGQTIISARDDSYNPLSTTLELIATDHPDDFATHYFGGSVTLHACGISEPA